MNNVVMASNEADAAAVAAVEQHHAQLRALSLRVETLLGSVARGTRPPIVSAGSSSNGATAN